MIYQTTTKAGIGIGALGLGVSILASGLLVLIPEYLMAPAARNAYINTWSAPIMTLGEAVKVYGLPLFSAAFAYRFTTENYPTKSIVTGFITGGLVLGVGTEILNVTLPLLIADSPAYSQSLISHTIDIVGLGGRLVGGALVGMVCANRIANHF